MELPSSNAGNSPGGGVGGSGPSGGVGGTGGASRGKMQSSAQKGSLGFSKVLIIAVLFLPHASTAFSDHYFEYSYHIMRRIVQSCTIHEN